MCFYGRGGWEEDRKKSSQRISEQIFFSRILLNIPRCYYFTKLEILSEQNLFSKNKNADIPSWIDLKEKKCLSVEGNKFRKYDFGIAKSNKLIRIVIN